MTQSIESVSGETIEKMLAWLDGVTPGPWGEGDKWVFAAPRSGEPHHALENILGNAEAQANAAHIARCDPDTMRSILTELQSLRTLSPAHGEAVAYIDRGVLAELGKHLDATGTVASGLLKKPFGDPVALYLSPASPPLEIDAARVLKDALFTLVKAECEPASYGGVLVADGKYARLTFELEGKDKPIEPEIISEAPPDHCYDPDDWEYSMPWEDRNELVEQWEPNEAHKVATLIDGPDKWVVLFWDEVNGEEIRWFNSEAEALAALNGAVK